MFVCRSSCVHCSRQSALTHLSTHVGLCATPSRPAVRTACCRTATRGLTCCAVIATRTTPTSAFDLEPAPASVGLTDCDSVEQFLDGNVFVYQNGPTPVPSLHQAPPTFGGPPPPPQLRTRCLENIQKLISFVPNQAARFNFRQR